MQDDGGQVSQQHRKVYTYWVDDDGRYIGLCLRYNRFLRYLIDIVYTVIWMSLLYEVVDSRHMYAVGFPLLLFTFIVYSWFLKRSAMYYSLDERGTPTEFLSSQKPESIRRVRPLTRKQFLKRVGEGARGGAMFTENVKHPGPFLMAIDSGTSGGVNADEVAVVGRIVRGTAVVGSTLDLVGFAPQIKHVKLVEIRIRGMTFYVLQGATTSDIERGQVLAAPGTIHLGTTFEAEVVLMSATRRSPSNPFKASFAIYSIFGVGTTSGHCSFLREKPRLPMVIGLWRELS